MADRIYYFEGAALPTAVVLPFSLDEVLDDWSGLRSAMVRHLPQGFSRDEWAYLMTFLDRKNLQGVFEKTFGSLAASASGKVGTIARPAGLVAVWLPNNVSLLGPLMLILLSLTGNPIRLKVGSESEALTARFLEFALEHLQESALKNYLLQQVRYETFGHEDIRHAEMARDARIRIVFGSDATAEYIHALPHPLQSTGVSFVDRRSEVWLEKAAITDEILRDLIKVFLVYGQAGCTSPRRVILLDGAGDEVLQLRDRLVRLWPDQGAKPGMHEASQNILWSQIGAATGWNTQLMPQHAAVLGVGDCGLSELAGTKSLMLLGASREDAVAGLPENIQTIGYAFTKPDDPAWLRLVAGHRVLRMVPVSQMHHFGPVWDGRNFWAECFEYADTGE